VNQIRDTLAKEIHFVDRRIRPRVDGRALSLYDAAARSGRPDSIAEVNVRIRGLALTLAQSLVLVRRLRQS